MDYPAPQQDLAEELSAARQRIADLEGQVAELSERIGNLALQLGKLTKVVRQVMSPGAGAPAAESEEMQPAAAELPAAPQPQLGGSSTIDLPVELIQAIKLVTEGRNDEAQRMVTSQPREILAQHPGVVALVAASVRIGKGEYDVARAALDKARGLLQDQRLLRVVKFLENQLPH